MSAVRNVVVYGAGGHGKVVADIVSLMPGVRLLGFIDDGREAGAMVMGHRVLGGAAWLSAADARGVLVALGVGDNAARGRVFDKVRAAELEVLTAIHPTAAVARSAQLGPGTVVMANVSVNPDARIGSGVILNTGCVVEHDCVVGDFAHLSPRAALGGGARVGARAHLGLGAIVLPSIGVGDDCVVGAGAVVTKELLAGVTAVGVPARPLVRRG